THSGPTNSQSEPQADAAKAMLRAANLGGKAINLTQTTAPHAMSYKLTSEFGLAHGHAVALCLGPVWRYMLKHIDEACVDPRGADYLRDVFADLDETFITSGWGSNGSVGFGRLVDSLALPVPRRWSTWHLRPSRNSTPSSSDWQSQ
ncbi:MAG: iron-containing alcohol dehydrogenase, partial [Promicromonosporaceae bacterium]|nr:iron-containing alcohol dehydrogenase [Promicromonosporaceae bacterium]